MTVVFLMKTFLRFLRCLTLYSSFVVSFFAGLKEKEWVMWSFFLLWKKSVDKKSSHPSTERRKYIADSHLSFSITDFAKIFRN